MIKMLTGVASAEFALAPNEITDVFSDAEEKRFVDSGQAEYVTAPKKTKKQTSK